MKISMLENNDYRTYPYYLIIHDILHPYSPRLQFLQPCNVIIFPGGKPGLRGDCNTCLNLAKMIVILKADKPPEEPSSYRPISLLPILAEIFEKIVLNRMQMAISTSNLLPPFQFGFQRQHSITEVVNTIRQALENKEFATAVFLNVKSAFDKIWDYGL